MSTRERTSKRVVSIRAVPKLPARWRVFLVEDQPITRHGLRTMLSAIDDVEVVGEAESGTEALARVKESGANLVLMDINLPGMDGLEATRRLKAGDAGAVVVVLTVREDADAVSEAFRAGAVGFISKSAGLGDLTNMLTSIDEDGVYLRPADTGLLLEAMGTEHEVPHKVLLTRRERQVLELLAEGQTARAIADHLQLGVRTVNTYVAGIYRKLGVANKVGAVREALRLGLIQAPV